MTTLELPEQARTGRAVLRALADPWAITPDGFRQVLTIAARAHEMDEQAIAKAAGREIGRRAEIRNGVGILPLHGPLFRYANLFTALSGATSLELAAKDFGELDASHEVERIVLEIDSPGGQVSGTSEFADMVRNSSKPVTALVSYYGCSAAYWIASAPNEVIGVDTAIMGSIGCVGGFFVDDDPSVIEIVSSQSPNKRPDARTEEGRAQLQAEIDALAAVFITTVARNRGLTEDQIVNDWNRGGVLVGQATVDAGMADRLGTLESVVAGESGVTTGGLTMSASTNQPVTREGIASDHPAIADAFREEGTAQAVRIIASAIGVAVATLAELSAAVTERIEGAATGERERIQAVLAQALPGHEELVQQLAFDGKTSGPEAAMQVLKAEKAAAASLADALASDAPKPAPAAEPGVRRTKNAEDPNAPLEERAKATWDSDAGIRDEFAGEFDRYLAFRRAYERGSVRYLRNRSA